MAKIPERQRSAEEEHLDDGNEAEFSSAKLTINAEGEVSPYREGTDRKPGDLNANQIGGAQSRMSSSAQCDESSGDATNNFFAIREGAVDKAVERCQPTILPHQDGDIRGAWLLTEIDHWDNEKERLVLLTDHTLIAIKYDFINLQILEYRRLKLSDFDKILIGDLTYPEASLIPKVDKLFGLVKEIMWARNPQKPSTTVTNSTKDTVACTGLLSFRHRKGVRALWNKGHPLHFSKSWNPWSREIPYATFTSHPLLSHKGHDLGTEKNKFNIDNFASALELAVDKANRNHDRGTPCSVEHQPIVIDNYLGLASFFHNVNNLGFFKSRGKVSF